MVHALEQIILPQILSQFYELCATAGGSRKLFYTALTEDGRKAGGKNGQRAKEGIGQLLGLFKALLSHLCEGLSDHSFTQAEQWSVQQLADWVKQSRVKSGDHQFHRPINACLRQLISDAPGQIELSAAAAEAPVMGNPSDVGNSLCDDVMVVVYLQLSTGR